MNAGRLLAVYDRVADAPDAIPRLRRFVLDLAVRGKLVPQDPKDEPASVAAKERIDQAGLPQGWLRAKVGGVLDLQYGKGLKANERADQGAIPVFGSNGIVGFTGEPLSTRPSIIIGRKGSAGALNLCDGPSWTTDVAYFVEAPSAFDLRYLHIALSALSLDELGKGVKPGLSRSDAYAQILSIPPLPEQHRIVAKVDELMALCDRLEAARTEREGARDRLATASLARLNTPDPGSFEADADFTLNHLSALTARLDQVRQLRQTVLNLAVRGKLVQQDPADEPVSELLRRVAAAKVERKKATGDARIRFAFNPSPEKLPMALPAGWAVQSFENLFLFIDYRGNTPAKTDRGIPLITAKNIRMGHLSLEPREYISEQTFATWMTRGFPERGDLFFTTEAPLANVCLNDLDEPFALAQRAICFQPYAPINTKFLMFALMSDVLQRLIDNHASGMTARGIKAANLKPLPVPIPPLPEQHRIVAKVEELTALCDHLQASLATAAKARDRLLESLLLDALNGAPLAEAA